MAYNLDLPPTVVRTNQASNSADDWELRTNSGTTIALYSRNGMSVDVWWEDLLAYVSNNATSTINAVEDITLLMIQQDWTVEA